MEPFKYYHDYIFAKALTQTISDDLALDDRVTLEEVATWINEARTTLEQQCSKEYVLLASSPTKPAEDLHKQSYL